MLQQGRIACRYDELTVDTPRNRYVKTTLTKVAGLLAILAENPNIENLRRRRVLQTGRDCRDLIFRLEMAGVAGYVDVKCIYRSGRLNNAGWLDAQERQMHAAAQLALDLVIPTEVEGRALFAMPDRDAHQGWKLYEAAVAGFYNVVLPGRDWEVATQRNFQWTIGDGLSNTPPMMPQMQPDIILNQRKRGDQSALHRIIVDTKFTEIVTLGRSGKEVLKSSNIYQIYAYLRTQENQDDPPSLHSTGVLLYPAIDASVDESAIIQGNRIRFATVDLAAAAQTIRKQLLRIVDD